MCPALFQTGMCRGPIAIASSTMLDTVAPPAALTWSYSLMVSVGLPGASLGNGLGGAFADATGYRRPFALDTCWLAVLLSTGILLRRVLLAGRPRRTARSAPSSAG